MASEYGWSKREILENVYLDDVALLAKVINRRKIGDMRIQLAIAQNPHVKDPKLLFKELESRQLELEGKSYLEAEFDQASFDALRRAIGSTQGSTVVVKKTT